MSRDVWAMLSWLVLVGLFFVVMAWRRMAFDRQVGLQGQMPSAAIGSFHRWLVMSIVLMLALGVAVWVLRKPVFVDILGWERVAS